MLTCVTRIVEDDFNMVVWMAAAWNFDLPLISITSA